MLDFLELVFSSNSSPIFNRGFTELIGQILIVCLNLSCLFAQIFFANQIKIELGEENNQTPSSKYESRF
jgi:hypothetical protein